MRIYTARKRGGSAKSERASCRTGDAEANMSMYDSLASDAPDSTTAAPVGQSHMTSLRKHSHVTFSARSSWRLAF